MGRIVAGAVHQPVTDSVCIRRYKDTRSAHVGNSDWLHHYQDSAKRNMGVVAHAKFILTYNVKKSNNMKIGRLSEDARPIKPYGFANHCAYLHGAKDSNDFSLLPFGNPAFILNQIGNTDAQRVRRSLRLPIVFVIRI